MSNTFNKLRRGAIKLIIGAFIVGGGIAAVLLLDYHYFAPLGMHGTGGGDYIHDMVLGFFVMAAFVLATMAIVALLLAAYIVGAWLYNTIAEHWSEY